MNIAVLPSKFLRKLWIASKKLFTFKIKILKIIRRRYKNVGLFVYKFSLIVYIPSNYDLTVLTPVVSLWKSSYLDRVHQNGTNPH